MKLRDDQPYHFGWRNEDDGGVTIQEVTIERDTMIYKEDEQWMTCLLLKEREEKWEKIEFVKESSHKKNTIAEIDVRGPDAM